MKKRNVLASFVSKEAFGPRNHSVIYFKFNGNYFVEYHFTTMSEKSVRCFGCDAEKALLFFIKKVHFLLS